MLFSRSVALLSALLAFLSLPGNLHAEDTSPDLIRSYGETYYVPAYSKIFSFTSQSELLASTLTVHNVDPDTSIELTAVSYHGEDGKKLKELTEEVIKLAPFGSRSYLIPRNDQTGGIGANFIVSWKAGTPALSPLVESVMIGGVSSPGTSFALRGRVIDRKTAPD